MSAQASLPAAPAKLVKVRPVNFSARSVRAILAGTKTQFRRPMKPQPTVQNLVSVSFCLDIEPHWTRGNAHWELDDVPDAEDPRMGAPWRVGQRLWVREQILTSTTDAYGPNFHIAFENQDPKSVTYFASGLPKNPSMRDTYYAARAMPRWASRLTLEVTGVRAERVANITHDDAKLEGYGGKVFVNGELAGAANSKRAFLAFWNRQYAKRGLGSEDVNPWVWVVSFRVVEGGS